MSVTQWAALEPVLEELKKESCFRGYHMFIRPFGMWKLESKCLPCFSPVMNAIDNAVGVVENGVV